MPLWVRNFSRFFHPNYHVTFVHSLFIRCQVQVIGQSSGEMIGSFRGHQSTVTSVNDSPDTHMKTPLSGIDTSQSRFPAIFSSSIDGTVYLWTATIDLSMKISFHVLFEWKTKQTIHSLWIPVKNKQISKSSDFETLSSNIENVTCDLEISVQTFYIIGKGDSNRKVLKRIDMSPNRGKSMKVTNPRNGYHFTKLICEYLKEYLL